MISVLALAGCAVSSSDEVMDRGANKGGFMGLSTNSQVEVSGEKALAGVQDVVIGSFKIGFTESAVESRKAGGGLLGSGSGGKSQGNIKLEGISNSDRQQITETAYRDFVATLTAQGYNVVDRSAFINSAAYTKAKKYTFPYTEDNSGFLSSYGKSTFFQPSSLGNEGIMFTNDIQGVTGGFAFSNGEMAATTYALESGIPIISATYLIDFATAGGHGNNWTSTSSVKVGQNLAVTSGTLKIVKDQSSSFKKGTAIMSLGQPIEAGKEFATIEDATATSDKVVMQTLNVTSAILGGGTNQKKDFVVRANAGKYRNYSNEIIEQANKALIGRAAQGR